MRFSRKEREQTQKIGVCGKKENSSFAEQLYFYGCFVTRNAGNATEVTAGEEAPPLPERSTENEVEGAA
ncbi:hypothetical protein FH008_15795 [Listeria monocytogenes]|nr:hypothetical protein [Listeria monocytogenes]EBF5126105.1 hypothetical protein [Listeria monocytogenes]EBF5152578.1 hypothetical protein [Listeria monocytogenes]